MQSFVNAHLILQINWVSWYWQAPQFLCTEWLMQLLTMCSRLWYDINVVGHTYLSSLPEPSLNTGTTNPPTMSFLSLDCTVCSVEHGRDYHRYHKMHNTATLFKHCRAICSSSDWISSLDYTLETTSDITKCTAQKMHIAQTLQKYLQQFRLNF